VDNCKPPDQFLAKLQIRYAKAKKKERGRILDDFVATTNYHRKHAIALLRGKRHHRDRAQPLRRLRARYYTPEDQRAVLWLAELFDGIGSKRLRVAMNNELVHLRRQRHLQVSATCHHHLWEMSPSTMDRFRRSAPRSQPRHRGGTKPGTLLKSQIPIRTFADWDDKRPGFVEVDLVQHEGGNSRGFFACTLTVTDVCTGWTEMRAVQTKAQKFVFAALKHVRTNLPVALRGIDSDNGEEFINDQLLRYCNQEHLTFTRGRVGRKNDNAFVESKNWSVVRRLVGYGRFDTQRQVDQLNALYVVYRLYVNHFLPVTKLVARVREGRRVKKVYDAPKTPYQRVLDSPEVSDAEKAKLCAIHVTLDVVKLKRQMDELMDALAPSKQW
jgi:hypothetical protein